MQIYLLAIILLLTIGATACKPPTRAGNDKLAGRCMEDLNSIPELAALKARNKEQPEERASGRALDGLEIALTLNDQVRTAGDPDDVDNWCEHEDSRENFERLVAALKAQQMPPVVDFAIGQRLDPQLAAAWVAQGNRLGVLTYSQKKPNKSSADEFIADIERNRQAVAPYQPKQPGQPKYFRFPRMKVSLDPAVRTRVDQLHVNAHFIGSFLHSAFDDVGNPELLRHSLQVFRFGLILRC